MGQPTGYYDCHGIPIHVGDLIRGDVPRTVFRVLYRDGRPFVAKRTLVSRKGSWVTTKTDGGIEVRENGNYWSESAIEAIQREAYYLMNRVQLPSQFDADDQFRHMAELIVEAFEWGRLIGAIEGLQKQVEEDRKERERE